MGSGRKRVKLAPIVSPLVPSAKRRVVNRGKKKYDKNKRHEISLEEREIVLDRLGKEIRPLLEQGSATRSGVKRRLCMGINAATKYLEAGAKAVIRAKKSAPGSASRGNGGVDSKGILLIDANAPICLTRHLYALVQLTETPHLVLPSAGAALGKVFGIHSTAVVVICPRHRPEPASVPPKETPSDRCEGQSNVAVEVKEKLKGQMCFGKDVISQGNLEYPQSSPGDKEVDSIIKFLCRKAQMLFPR